MYTILCVSLILLAALNMACILEEKTKNTKFIKIILDFIIAVNSILLMFYSPFYLIYGVLCVLWVICLISDIYVYKKSNLSE